ncbi:unnamed protein product [Allacma fusca]|uniref:Uncharacterized protein n=1 Tax=Allacma fusca TaxID=39272 RepID=A0A8J2JML9_9HEXA|nr:unnamed protein product [Allacma fusca]
MRDLSKCSMDGPKYSKRYLGQQSLRELQCAPKGKKGSVEFPCECVCPVRGLSIVKQQEEETEFMAHFGKERWSIPEECDLLILALDDSFFQPLSTNLYLSHRYASGAIFRISNQRLHS